MPRPKLTPEGTVLKAFRMPPDFWRRADMLAKRLGHKRGTVGTATAVIREACARGLDLIERELEEP